MQSSHNQDRGGKVKSLSRDYDGTEIDDNKAREMWASSYKTFSTLLKWARKVKRERLVLKKLMAH